MFRPNITTASCASFLALYVSATIGVLNLAKVVPTSLQNYLFSPSHVAWPREPYCISQDREFCVYTSNITETHSLSMILSPEDAENGSKALLELVSTSSQDQTEKPRAWQVVDIPSKGKGVMATRDIGKYETIMVDHAAVVMDVDVPEVWSSRLLKVAIDRLHLPSSIRALGAGEGDGPLEQRVMKTNGFGTSIAGVGTKALFPLASVGTSRPHEKFDSDEIENQSCLHAKRIRSFLPHLGSHDIDKGFSRHRDWRRNHHFMYLNFPHLPSLTDHVQTCLSVFRLLIARLHCNHGASHVNVHYAVHHPWKSACRTYVVYSLANLKLRYSNAPPQAE